MRRHKKWHLHRIDPVYVPAAVKATRDLSEFYEKPPSEMSRYELNELERLLMMSEEEREQQDALTEKLQPMFDDDGN